MKFLLINDNALVQKLVEVTAQKANIELTKAKDCSDFADLAQFDYVIVDDDSLNADKDRILGLLSGKRACLLYSKNGEMTQGFSEYIRKPFIPTSVLDIMLAEVNKAKEMGASAGELSADFEFNLDDPQDEVDLDLAQGNAEKPQGAVATENVGATGADLAAENVGVAGAEHNAQDCENLDLDLALNEPSSDDVGAGVDLLSGAATNADLESGAPQIDSADLSDGLDLSASVPEVADDLADLEAPADVEPLDLAESENLDSENLDLAAEPDSENASVGDLEADLSADLDSENLEIESADSENLNSESLGDDLDLALDSETLSADETASESADLGTDLSDLDSLDLGTPTDENLNSENLDSQNLEAEISESESQPADDLSSLDDLLDLEISSDESANISESESADEQKPAPAVLDSEQISEVADLLDQIDSAPADEQISESTEAVADLALDSESLNSENVGDDLALDSETLSADETASDSADLSDLDSLDLGAPTDENLNSENLDSQNLEAEISESENQPADETQNLEDFFAADEPAPDASEFEELGESLEQEAEISQSSAQESTPNADELGDLADLETSEPLLDSENSEPTEAAQVQETEALDSESVDLGDLGTESVDLGADLDSEISGTDELADSENLADLGDLASLDEPTTSESNETSELGGILDTDLGADLPDLDLPADEPKISESESATLSAQSASQPASADDFAQLNEQEVGAALGENVEAEISQSCAQESAPNADELGDLANLEISEPLLDSENSEPTEAAQVQETEALDSESVDLGDLGTESVDLGADLDSEISGTDELADSENLADLGDLASLDEPTTSESNETSELGGILDTDLGADLPDLDLPADEPTSEPTDENLNSENLDSENLEAEVSQSASESIAENLDFENLDSQTDGASAADILAGGVDEIKLDDVEPQHAHISESTPPAALDESSQDIRAQAQTQIQTALTKGIQDSIKTLADPRMGALLDGLEVQINISFKDKNK